MADAAGTLQSEGLIPDGHVPVVDPSGALTTVHQDDYSAALDRGYRFQSPEEQQKFYVQKKYGEGLGPVKAGIAGAARAITLGVSDVLAPGVGIRPSTLRGLQEANPVASTVGDVAGTAASLLVPGLDEMSGPALIGKVGREVEAGIAPTTLMGRLATKAVSGGVEGTLFGVGKVVSDEALGDPDLNAQKLAAHFGLNAVLGSAGGLFGGALDEAVSPLAEKLSQSLSEAPGTLKQLAENRWLKAIGGIQGDISKIPEWKRGAVADMARSYMKPGQSLREAFEEMMEGHGEAGEAIGKVLSGVDGAGGVGSFDYNQHAWSIVDWFNKLDPYEQNLIRPSALNYLETLGERAGSQPGFEAMHNGINKLGRDTNWKAPINLKSDLHSDLDRGLYRTVRDDFDRQLVDFAQKSPGLGTQVSQDYVAANAKYSALSDALTLAKHGLNRLNNRSVSASDYMTGIALGLLKGGPVGAATGVASAFGHKLLRERGASVVATLMDKIAESPVLSQVAKSFAVTAQKAASGGIFGQYAPLLLSAIGESPAAGLATHIALSQTDPAYRKVAAMAQMTPDTPAETQAALEKAHTHAKFQTALSLYDVNVAKQAAAMVKGEKPAETSLKVLGTQDMGDKRQRKTDENALMQRLSEVAQLSARPDAVVDRVSGNVGSVGDHAPAITAALSGLAQRALSFLQSKAPTGQIPTAPLAPSLPASKSDAAKFSRYLQAIQDPGTAMRHAASGVVSPEAQEALQAVFGKLKQHMVTEVLDKLTDRPKVSYQQRVALAHFTGMDLDGTMSPAMVNTLQSVYVKPQQTPPSGGNKPTAKGTSRLTVAARNRTATQASEARGAEGSQ